MRASTSHEWGTSGPHARPLVAVLAWALAPVALPLGMGAPVPAQASVKADLATLQTVTSATADWVARRRTKKKKKKKDESDAPDESSTEAETPEVAAPADLPPPPELPRKYRAVAVLPLEGIDVTEEILHSIRVSIVREVDETRGMRAVSPDSVTGALEKVGLSSECEGDLGCLARAGRYARAHLALDTRVAAIGGTLSLSMRLVDTRNEREVGRVADSVSEEERVRATELHRLAVQLLSPESYVGALHVKVSEPDAEVYLDDKLVGTTPLPKPLAGLRAGPHILRISKPGFSDINRFVDVVYKRSSTIDVDLTNNTIAGVIVEEVSTTGFGTLFVATQESGVEVRVDGEPKGSTPMTEAVPKVAAGTRRVSFHREGMETGAQEVEIVVDKRTDIGLAANGTIFAVSIIGTADPSSPLPDATLLASIPVENIPTAAGAQPREYGWKLQTGMVLGGLGALGILAGGVFSNQVRIKNIRANNLEKRYETRCPEGIPTDGNEQWCGAAPPRADALNDDGNRWALLQWVSYGVGGGLALAGAALILWDIRDVASGPETQVEGPGDVEVGISPVPGGAMFLLGGRF